MEAHDALSAKIVGNVGFEGVWASGFAIASSLGLRDCNEASWSQVLTIVSHMAEATETPILVDGDSGFGNFNNVRRFVRALGRVGVAGICLEDKLFPKLNSFIGSGQPLAALEEFCGKIKAAKDAQDNAQFSVVARTEAFVAGLSIDDALQRAEACWNAGADAIVIHSKSTSGDEVLEFARRWARRSPLLAIPTTYHASAPPAMLHEAGVSAIVWANYNIRAATRAMQSSSRAIRETGTPAAIEPSIATMDELFDLLNYAELEAAERRYLPLKPEP